MTVSGSTSTVLTILNSTLGRASKLTFADLFCLPSKIEALATLMEVPSLVIKNVTIKLDSPFAGKLAKDHAFAPASDHASSLSKD